jgi:hypothetical protein
MRTSKQATKKERNKDIAIEWQEMIEWMNWLLLHQRRRKHGCNAVPGLEGRFEFIMQDLIFVM